MYSKIFRKYPSDKNRPLILILPRKAFTLAKIKLRIPPPLKRYPLLGHDVLLRQGEAAPGGDENWLRACFERSDIFFDIGANVGYTALVALLIGHVQEVILVDANPNALAYAAEHLIRNQVVTRARFVCAFVGEAADQKIKFWTTGTSASGSMYKAHHYAINKDSYIEVPTVSVDALCQQFSLLPDFVKIDVEGAEAKVLAGALDCAAQMKTRFMVEMHRNPVLSMLENATQVVTWCQRVNYAAWYLADGTQVTDPAQIQHVRRCYLLLQPASWPFPDWLAGVPQYAIPV